MLEIIVQPSLKHEETVLINRKNTLRKKSYMAFRHLVEATAFKDDQLLAILLNVQAPSMMAED